MQKLGIFLRNNYLVIVYVMTFNSLFWSVIYFGYIKDNITCRYCDYIAVPLALVFMFASVLWMFWEFFERFKWWTFLLFFLMSLFLIIFQIREEYFFAIPFVYLITSHLFQKIKIFKNDEVTHLRPIAFIRTMGTCSDTLSKQDLQKIFPTASSSRVNDYYNPINEAICIYNISNLKSLAYFFGQVSVETLDLKFTEEQGPKNYFNRYDGRADLCNDQPGDGYRFKGRGLIQLTGRCNYSKFQKYARANFSKYASLDITSSTSNAEQVANNLELNVLASFWYWFEGNKSVGIQKSVQQDDIYWVSVYVNGRRKQKHPYCPNKDKEPNHMSKRVKGTNIARKALGV